MASAGDAAAYMELVGYSNEGSTIGLSPATARMTKQVFSSRYGTVIARATRLPKFTRPRVIARRR